MRKNNTDMEMAGSGVVRKNLGKIPQRTLVIDKLSAEGDYRRDPISVRFIALKGTRELIEVLKQFFPGPYKFLKRTSPSTMNDLRGCCVPHKRKTKDGRGFREFTVLISGTGLQCVDTAIHEVVHVAERAFPKATKRGGGKSEEDRCQVVAALSSRALQWLAAKKWTRVGDALFPKSVRKNS